MTHPDNGQNVPSATPNSGLSSTPSTGLSTPSTGQVTGSATPSIGIIAARAGAIAGLTMAGSGVLFIIGRAFEPLTVMALSGFAALVCVPLFFGAAIVHMVVWRKRAAATGAGPSYGVRVRRLAVTWVAIMLVAALSIGMVMSALAAAMDVKDEGNWLFAFVMVAPVLVLGLVGIAVVESVYERKTRAAAVPGA